MKIAIYILGGLLLCATIIIISLWQAIRKILDDNPDTMINYYFQYDVEEEFPCSLLLTLKENADFDGSVFDFSQYEEKGIISLINCKKGNKYNHKYEDSDGNPLTTLLTNQVVYKMKDGSFQWDFRRLP